MSFASSFSTTLIFCEGETNGPDERLIRRLVSETVDGYLVRPVGGKRGLRSFINGYLAGSTGSFSPRTIALRDRDFDVQPPDEVRLIRLHGSLEIYLLHRAAIENYFLDADLMHGYLADGRTKKGETPDRETIARIISESAEQLTAYESIRWAVASLKPGTRWPELSPRLHKKGSGYLPEDLSFEGCMSLAVESIERYRAQTQEATVDRLRESAERFHTQFQAARLEEKIIWFHGKDLLKLIRKNIFSYCERQEITIVFGDREFKEWAVQHVEINQHADLLQFAQRLEVSSA